MKHIYTLLIFALSFGAYAQETVIAVWDFKDNSTVGTVHADYSSVTGQDLGFLTDAIHTDETGDGHDNAITVNAGNLYSKNYITDLGITPSKLVDGKLHTSISYKNISMANGNTLKTYMKGKGNANYIADDGAGTHRMSGVYIEQKNGVIEVKKVAMNNGSQYGTAKLVGDLGASYAQDITIGVTQDFTNGTTSFWVGSPGANASTPFGLVNATDANQSTDWTAVTKTASADYIVDRLQFQLKGAGGTIEIDQVKISTGTYENTVAAGDASSGSGGGSGGGGSSNDLHFKGVIDFPLPGKWIKGVHLKASADISDLLSLIHI